MGSQEDLLEAVESLKSMMMARATGSSPNEEDYMNCRKIAISSPEIKALLPKFVSTHRTLSEFWPFIQGKFSTYKERRMFISDAFDPVLSFLEQGTTIPADQCVTDVMAKIDSAEIRLAWAKALNRRETDPDGAITAARTLMEATCKHILDDLEIEYTKNDDLPKLYHKVAASVNLSPSQHTEDIFKQILGGCKSVVHGLGSLRNEYGDAHANGKGGAKPAPRHAQLAVNLAGATAMFLYETWEHVNTTTG